MALLTRLLLAALCAGVLSGALAAAAHQLGTVPLILQAETYEHAPAHEHGSGAEWEPANGLERFYKLREHQCLLRMAGRGEAPE